MSVMIERLEGMVNRYHEINEMMMSPEIVTDSRMLAKLGREQADLTQVVETYTEYKNSVSALEDAKALLLEDDKEIKEMAKMEIEELEPKIEEYLEKLEILLIPKDPNDSHNAIVEIRGAAGGDEGNIFAGDLYRMYSKFAESQGWKIEIVEMDDCEAGGFSLVSFMVRGDGVYGKLKFESGSHRVQRVPKTESQGRIHTSTATVLVTPEIEPEDFDIDMNDLEMETMRASGAGGQHINKTSSAVRLIHKATGIVVACQTERSQLQNKENCLRMLRSKLVEIKEREHLEKISDIKGVQQKIEWGSQIRSYVFMPYTLAKDTRTGFENANINAVMDGDIDGFINAYLSALATGVWEGSKGGNM